MTQEALRTYYDNTRDEATRTTSTVLLNETDVWIDGKLGRESTWKIRNSTVKNRMLLIGNRQYQMLISIEVAVMENAGAQKTINKFLNSFQLIEN